jgi:hypothetical protein
VKLAQDGDLTGGWNNSSFADAPVAFAALTGPHAPGARPGRSELSTGAGSGLASSLPHALASPAFTVLPTVFTLVLFYDRAANRYQRGNIISLRRTERIRAYYAALARIAPPYFETDDSVARNKGVRYSRWSFVFTMASMVMVVNSVLGGSAGTLILILCLLYEHRRLTPVVLSSPAASAGARGDATELS